MQSPLPVTIVAAWAAEGGEGGASMGTCPQRCPVYPMRAVADRAQSHASYGRCGVGSEGTDSLVALVSSKPSGSVSGLEALSAAPAMRRAMQATGAAAWAARAPTAWWRWCAQRPRPRALRAPSRRCTAPRLPAAALAVRRPSPCRFASYPARRRAPRAPSCRCTAPRSPAAAPAVHRALTL